MELQPARRESPTLILLKKKLMQAGVDRGHQIHIETQGLAGTQDALTQQEIDEADVVIIAADIKVNGRDRFKNKKW